MKALTQSEALPRTGWPVLSRYLRDLGRIRAWKVLALHYSVVLALMLGFWSQAMEGDNPHPEILLKLLGSYCFLIGAIAIPLVSPLLFPDIGESDPAFDALPSGPIQVFDARLTAQMLLSALALLPILPIFLAFDPITGRPFDSFDIIPFFLGVVTSGWVQLIMEVSTPTGDRTGAIPRRLAVVGAFILLHIGLVGLLSQLAFHIVQRANLLKLLIDLNPFSQLFILMEGENQERLLFNTYSQTLIDFRLYLFIIQTLVFLTALAIWRANLKSRTGSWT